MARQCMRPGCDRPAAARLTYDTAAAAVWLDRPVAHDQPAQQVCSVHAATLTAPLGWTVTDRRLVAVGTPADPGRPPPPEPSGDVVGHDAAHDAAHDAELDTADREEPGVEHRVAAVASPENGSDADAGSPPTPGEGDRPRGKLLDRAFEWTGPQHSVLTTGRDFRHRSKD